MVRRFFLDFYRDYHGFTFLWDGKSDGVIMTILSQIPNCGNVLILLP